MIQSLFLFPFLFSLYEFHIFDFPFDELKNNTAELRNIADILEKIRIDNWASLQTDNFVSVATILFSILTPFGVLLYQEHRMRLRVTKFSKSNLRKQINEVIKILTFPNPDNAISILANQKSQPVNFLFLTDFYERIINSDLYLHLDEDLSESLILFFNNIKRHNQLLNERNLLLEQSHLNKDKSAKYKDLIDKKNEELLKIERQIIAKGYVYIYKLK